MNESEVKAEIVKQEIIRYLDHLNEKGIRHLLHFMIFNTENTKEFICQNAKAFDKLNSIKLS